MPAVALGWYFAASLLRLTRSSMLEVLRSEYIKLARLKGLPGYVVIAMHAFKNALIPVLTLAGINLVVMINAAVIIEVIFAWPGIGRLLYEGIFQRDFPLVQGVVMLAGIMIVLINLIIDILYAYIDPRIRLSQIGDAWRSLPNRPDRCWPAHAGAGGLRRRWLRFAGRLPIVPLAILVPFVLVAVFANVDRALRPDRADPRRQDLRAAVLGRRAATRRRCSAPTSRAATCSAG